MNIYLIIILSICIVGILIIYLIHEIKIIEEIKKETEIIEDYKINKFNIALKIDNKKIIILLQYIKR